MDKILGFHRGERDELGEKLFQALRDAMPWGLEIDLGMGRKAVLTKLNGNPEASQPYRRPIYDSPKPVSDEKPVGYHEWSIMFDFQLTNCDQDHIEVTARITGGGGMV